MRSLAPSDAKWRAMAFPIPREAPVTTATLSLRGNMAENKGNKASEGIALMNCMEVMNVFILGEIMF